MVNGLLTTGAHITPGITLRFHKLGHVVADPETAAERMRGFRAPYHAVAEHGRNHKTGKSDEGQVTLLNCNLVCCFFKEETIVAADPYHCEVIAFSTGTRHLQNIRGFRKYIHGCGDELGPTPVRQLRSRHRPRLRVLHPCPALTLQARPSASGPQRPPGRTLRGQFSRLLHVKLLGVRSVAARALLSMRSEPCCR
jgi:hypothetical protein